MITLLKFDRYYSETRNHINPAMENLFRLCVLEKENSFVLYKTPLKTNITKSLVNKFGIKSLSQVNFSKINSGKVFILNPSLLEKDISGMNRLFQHCQDHGIDVFTYVCDEWRYNDSSGSNKFFNIVKNCKDYTHQIFEISEKTGMGGAKIYVKRDIILNSLV